MLRRVGHGETVKRTEADNRLVDYLYDELDDEDRKAFAEHLKSDADAAAEVASTAALLKLYREEAEELTPSVAATERILAEARRASRPWYAALFGDWLPALLLRPAVGIAAVAVLVVGIGVFAFLSQDRGPESPGTASRSAGPTSASAPEKATSGELAEATTSRPGRHLPAGKAGPADPANSEPDQAGALAASDQPAAKDKTNTLDLRQKNGLNDWTGRGGGSSGARADGTDGVKDAKKAEEQVQGVTGRKAEGYLERSRDPAPARRAAPRFHASTRNAAGEGRKELESPTGAVPPQAAPATPPAKPVGQGAAVYKQGLVMGGADRSLKSEVSKTQAKAPAQSAPVLYNRASTSLAKGRIAEACNLFASLVRSHRDYPQRADALLGWARCEMARGAFGRAEAVIQQLIKEHPAWRKSGEAWLAEIQKQRQNAVLRAQQRARRYQQKAAPARPAARPSRSSTSSD